MTPTPRHISHLAAESVFNPGIASIAGALTVRPPEWTADALCAHVDPDLWFPEKGGPTKQAKQVCARCPVIAECLGCGMNERYGVYGGLSERERRKLRGAAAAEREATA